MKGRISEVLSCALQHKSPHLSIVSLPPPRPVSRLPLSPPLPSLPQATQRRLSTREVEAMTLSVPPSLHHRSASSLHLCSFKSSYPFLLSISPPLLAISPATPIVVPLFHPFRATRCQLPLWFCAVPCSFS